MTEPKSESIKEIADYLEVKYKILLWKNFTREKRSDEWYKENTPTTSPFVNDGLHNGQIITQNWKVLKKSHNYSIHYKELWQRLTRIQLKKKQLMSIV
jgi:hypothetical protein